MTAIDQASTKANPVKIWFTRCGGATASTVAIRKNWLQEEFSGSEVTLSSLRESDDPTVRASHYDHNLTSMFREGGNIPPIWARAKGVDTVTLGITWVDEYQAVVTRPDSDIRELSDLKGRRLAVPLHKDIAIDFQRGAALHGFKHALGLAGIDRGAVEFVDIPVEPGAGAAAGGGHGFAVLAALANREVDAAFLRQGTGFKLWQERAPELRQLLKITDLADPLQRVNNGTPRPITVHRSFLDRHPDLVVRYLAVLLRAAAWAEANPSEAVKVVAAEGGDAREEVTALAYPRLAASLTPKLTSDYVRGLEAQKNFLRDWGFLANDFDIGSWIEAGPLEEAQRLVAREARSAA
jgi:ABC-type nitrate/sulfonate/bicarbonate transport system substrate-binding protein